MKKFIALLISLVCIFTLCACGTEKTPAEKPAPDYEWYFYASVTEVSASRLLVEVTDPGTSGLSAGTPVHVSTDFEGYTACSAGDIILVAYDGMVQELYPPIIPNVFAIEVIEKNPAWGVVFRAQDITPTSLTLTCHQYGGTDAAELMTGSYFVIQKSGADGWTDVEYLPMEYELAWTAESWIIPKNDSVTWDVKWGNLYGELPAGEYRIGKQIMNFRGTGDFDQTMVYAGFVIE